MKIQSGHIEDSNGVDSNGTTIQSQDLRIQFPTPFDSKPILFAALSGIQISSGYDIDFNIEIDEKKIEKEYALITVTAKERCIIKRISIKWIAYTQ